MRYAMKIIKQIITLFLILFVISCKDSYDLPVNIPATGYLVVDGTINSGQGATYLNLSKTVRLVDSFSINYVTNAAVTVEGEDNSRFTLTHRGKGQYVNDQLSLGRNQKYRLRIKLTDGKEYLSSYLAVKQSPPIDSVQWERDDAGVYIYANAKGSANTTGYYRWDYDEDWEFHSQYAPTLKYDTKPSAVYIFQNQSTDFSRYICYQASRSTTIEILSTAKISRDTTHYRLVTIPRASWKLSVLYSILVRQYSISREGYEYLSRMKKNTEQTGSIFDSQPSELKGNIVCVTNPNEPVIGYLEISDMYSKRIFIKNSEVPSWGYTQGCSQNTLVNHPDSIQAAGYPAPVAPLNVSLTGTIIDFTTTEVICVDCTLRGVVTKPSFWP